MMEESKAAQAPPEVDGPEPLSEEGLGELMTAWWNLTQAMKRHMTPVLEREHGLEFKDFVALSAIEEGANYPGLLCGRTALTPSAVSRLIDDLAGSGLVQRRMDEQDSRRVQLSLTDRGEAVLAATRRTMHEVLRRGLDSLPPEQIQVFAFVLQRLAGSMSQPTTPTATPNPATPNPVTSNPATPET